MGRDYRLAKGTIIGFAILVIACAGQVKADDGQVKSLWQAYRRDRDWDIRATADCLRGSERDPVLVCMSKKAGDAGIAKLAQLRTLADGGDTEAMYYMGVALFDYAEAMGDRDIGGATGRDMFRKAKERFQEASEAGIAEASWNVAVIVQRGLAGPSSNRAAAEWFVRAGMQYLDASDRDSALAALERVEGLGEGESDDAGRLATRLGKGTQRIGLGK